MLLRVNSLFQLLLIWANEHQIRDEYISTVEIFECIHDCADFHGILGKIFCAVKNAKLDNRKFWFTFSYNVSLGASVVSACLDASVLIRPTVQSALTQWVWTRFIENFKPPEGDYYESFSLKHELKAAAAAEQLINDRNIIYLALILLYVYTSFEIVSMKSHWRKRHVWNFNEGRMSAVRIKCTFHYAY